MKHTEKFLQKRKFMMALPVLVLPFITMIFWALGGGQGSPVHAMTLNRTGLNTALPDARFKKEEETWDKFTLYEDAARDSAEYETARENDPYFDLVSYQEGQDRSKEKEASKLIGTFKQKDRLAVDPNEEKVNNKLQQLYQEINRVSTPKAKTDEPQELQDVEPEVSSQMTELQSLMESMNEDESDSDPEMKQIENMIEKILDIQHPERVKDRMQDKTDEHQKKNYAVEPVAPKQHVSLISIPAKTPARPDSTDETPMMSTVAYYGFYGLDDNQNITPQNSNTIQAIIHETQELVAGATVRMRLLSEVTINDQLIPKDQFVYGICSINGERLLIDITSIRSGNMLLPVSLSVYDLDGLQGIYIPGAISRDAAKQASDDALQNVQMFTMDQSVGAQAASAGIEATKGLLSKKAKLVKVTVKSGYQIFLKDARQE